MKTTCAQCRTQVDAVAHTCSPAGRPLCPACAGRQATRRQRLIVAIGAQAGHESTASADTNEQRRIEYAHEDNQRDQRRIISQR